MLLLTRTVRFAINDPDSDAPTPLDRPANSYAGHPSIHGLGRHYELDIISRGQTDSATGFFVNISEIDREVRAAAIPLISAAATSAHRLQLSPAGLLHAIVPLLADKLHGHLHAVGYRLTPYHSIEMTVASQNTILMRQKFEFAASHRLYVASMSSAENLALFGKCTSPRGHGHNYVVEPCIRTSLSPQGKSMSLQELERITHDEVIARFDHKHLNEDTEEFSSSGGLNPTVENIARVIYERLAPRIARAGRESELVSVTVWETEKTSCTYPA